MVASCQCGGVRTSAGATVLTRHPACSLIKYAWMRLSDTGGFVLSGNGERKGPQVAQLLTGTIGALFNCRAHGGCFPIFIAALTKRLRELRYRGISIRWALCAFPAAATLASRKQHTCGVRLSHVSDHIPSTSIFLNSIIRQLLIHSFRRCSNKYSSDLEGSPVAAPTTAEATAVQQ